jgi:hypothetical protein
MKTNILILAGTGIITAILFWLDKNPAEAELVAQKEVESTLPETVMWERVCAGHSDVTYRLKVPGGWIVNHNGAITTYYNPGILGFFQKVSESVTDGRDSCQVSYQT